MKPRALAGPLVPREAWEARVEGVFRGAIALAHPDGLWITVLRVRGDMEPRGIWPGRAAFDALAGLVIPGGKIVFSDTAGPALTAAGVSVRTGTLETWDPRPEIAAAAAAFRAAGRAALSAGAARIEAALAEYGYSEGLHGDGPFGRRFAELRREPGFPWNLAGFGPGTTPGGDDFLAGWILGRILRGEGGEALEAAARIDPARTTVPGRTLLAGAARGMFPAYLVRAARALASAASGSPPEGAERELASAFRSAFRHGASSGRDAMLGMMEGAAG